MKRAGWPSGRPATSPAKQNSRWPQNRIYENHTHLRPRNASADASKLWRDESARQPKTTSPPRSGNVAQVFNLLYRRLPVGRRWAKPAGLEFRGACGLEIRDTADCKSALRLRSSPRWLLPPPSSVPPTQCPPGRSSARFPNSIPNSNWVRSKGIWPQGDAGQPRPDSPAARARISRLRARCGGRPEYVRFARHPALRTGGGRLRAECAELCESFFLRAQYPDHEGQRPVSV